MRTRPVSENNEAVPDAILRADWLVAFGPAVGHLPAAENARRWRTHATGFAVIGASGSDLRWAEDAQFVLLFTGVLTNVQELQPEATQADAARIALRLVSASGPDAFSSLRGPFAVIVWDRLRGTLLAARDQIGMQPLFYARNGSGGWLLSPSPDALVAQPGVSRAPDTVALSGWICGWYPANDDSAYRDVKKIPPATAVSFNGADASKYRYWNPYAEPIAWLREADLEQFEPLLTRAIIRAAHGQQAAIFLSGGVDSISVAVAATDLARRTGTLPPLALSIAFPDKASNEEVIQSGVAQRLGLEQVLLPFGEAVGPNGLLRRALVEGSDWPQPMYNAWIPAYSTLARHATAQNRRVILTGRGGDEWLTVSPWLLADQLKRGDFAGAWRLLQTDRQSRPAISDTARLLFTAGCRPLASAAFDAVTPRLWHQYRRRRLLTELPGWVAPDLNLRRALKERLDRWIKPARPVEGFYCRAGREAVEHPAVTRDMEETQEFGRRHGVRHMHPYWDVELLEMLRRVPPDLLTTNGRSKSLVRPRLARRLPGLGLANRVKTDASGLFGNIVEREGPEEWRRVGGVGTLGRIGVVDSKEVQTGAWQPGWTTRLGGPGRAWMLMMLENWVQQRI